MTKSFVQSSRRILREPARHRKQRLPAAANIFLQPRQQLPMAGKINRPAIVGIDQAEVPNLLAVVDVGHAGRSQLQQRLPQRAVEAPIQHLFVKTLELRQEAVFGAIVEHGRHKLADGGVVFRIGIDPTRVNLRLVRGFLHVGPQAVGQFAQRLRRAGAVSGHTPASVW